MYTHLRARSNARTHTHLVLVASVEVNELVESALLEKFGFCVSRGERKLPPWGILAVAVKVCREAGDLGLCFAADAVPRAERLQGRVPN
jgi:hypothetical protein